MAQRRMRTGKIATDEMIAALATEAEAGYAPEQIRSSRVGRPPIGDGFTRVVQFRVEEALFEELLARASAEGQGVSEIARGPGSVSARVGAALCADRVAASARCRDHCALNG